MGRVRNIDGWTIRLPLKRPVVFATTRYDARDYAIVRVRDDEGHSGFAYCLGRSAPVTATARALAPAVLGAESWHATALWDRLYAASIPFGQRGLALRALSLIDVALWDMNGHDVGRPVHALLGTARTTVDVSVGGGYFREQRGLDEIRDEYRTYVDAGFRLLKIPAGGWPARDEQRWVEVARETVGDDVGLAIDAHWTWSDVQSAADVLERLDPYRLAWVEDPLLPEAIPELARLARRIRSPLAIGDELSGRWVYRDLAVAGVADLWRVDVLTVGGFTEFRRICALAETFGIPIATHIYPEIHVHAAASSSVVAWTEYVAPEADIDLSHRFIDNPLRPRAGTAEAPDTAGLGFDLNWELIESTCVESWSMTTDGTP